MTHLKKKNILKWILYAFIGLIKRNVIAFKYWIVKKISKIYVNNWYVIYSTIASNMKSQGDLQQAKFTVAVSTFKNSELLFSSSKDLSLIKMDSNQRVEIFWNITFPRIPRGQHQLTLQILGKEEKVKFWLQFIHLEEFVACV